MKSAILVSLTGRYGNLPYVWKLVNADRPG